MIDAEEHVQAELFCVVDDAVGKVPVKVPLCGSLDIPPGHALLDPGETGIAD